MRAQPSSGSSLLISHRHGTVSEPLIAHVGAGANEEDDPSAEGSPSVDMDGMSDNEEVRDEAAADALSDVDDESDSAMSEDAPLSEEESASAVVAVAPEAPYGSHDTGACIARPH